LHRAVQHTIPNAWDKNSDARNFHQEARGKISDARGENYEARSENREPPYEHREPLYNDGEPSCDKKWHIYHQEMMHLLSAIDALSISK